MMKSSVDAEYLSDVWSRIDSIFSERKIAKYKIAKKCGFDRKILYACSRRNLTLTYFARLCEELNVSADFFLFGLDKSKEETHVATYKQNKCYEDMPTQQEIFEETKKLMMSYKEHDISFNGRCGIATQRELMTLADDFGLLHREDVQKIIETCKSYTEGQQKIMRVYEAVYLK